MTWAEGHNTNILGTIPVFSLIWLISLQPVCGGGKMLGWIKEVIE